MIRLALAAGLLAASLAPAAAQTSDASPRGRVTINAQLVKLLQDGYEIKAAFAEGGVPFVLVQKTTSAYLCRGAGAATCEKLN
jgi:hypothetical protein